MQTQQLTICRGSLPTGRPFPLGTAKNPPFPHADSFGEYHYHGIPDGSVAKLIKGNEMTLIGWAADGFPIYARYGYSDPMDASSAAKVVESRCRL